MPKTALDASAPSRNPLREALALAIAREAEASAALSRTLTAIRGAERIVLDAEGRKVRAEADAVAARDGYAASIAQAAIDGESPGDARALRTSRMEEVVAADEVECATEALRTIRAPLAELQAVVEQRRRAVERAAGDVFGPTLCERLETIRASIKALATEAMVLRTVRGNIYDTGGMDEIQSARRSALRMCENVTMLHLNTFSTEGADLSQAPDVVAWRVAFEALKTDADAPLPVE